MPRKTAHSAAAPWRGRSALDAVELMSNGWQYRREHLRLSQRSHSVITNGGDQPNVVPSNASIWWYFREIDQPHKRVGSRPSSSPQSQAPSRGPDNPRYPHRRVV